MIRIMDHNSTSSFFQGLILIITFVLFLIVGSNPTFGSENQLPPDTTPVGIFDLYKDGNLAAKNIPVWNPFSFFPRANDFVSDETRANVKIRLEVKKAVRKSFDTGLKSITYKSLPNPYYGKFSWNKPSEWSRHSQSNLPIYVKVHSPVAKSVKWIDVYVNGKEKIFRERFEQSFQATIDLSDIETNSDNQVNVHVKLLDQWGNTVTTPKRTIYVDG